MRWDTTGRLWPERKSGGGLSIAVGSTATAAAIRGQQRPAACFAASFTGQGGGGAWLGQWAMLACLPGVTAAAGMMAGGMAKAHRVTSQRTARASIRSKYRQSERNE